MSESLQQYLTVHALTEYIKRKFDNDPHLQRVFVAGEVSNYRRRPNHQYFTLKDEHATISAVMFASHFNKLKFKVEEGMKVLVTGRISVYPDSGRYQIYVETMEPDGVGALYLAFEQLKKKFKEAGLFDLPKKPLPAYPKKIAIISSRSGAVIHDIATTLERRNPLVQWELFEAKVQGADSPQEIIQRLQQITQRQDEFDLIIIARGGGSIEDLWGFNNEDLAHAIIASQLPIISSIGHETDTTLADLVADVRAATPTAAAELAAPVLLDIKNQLAQYDRDLKYTIYKHLELLSNRLSAMLELNVLKYPDRLIEPYIQKLDIRQDQLMQLKNQYFNEQGLRINHYSQGLNLHSLSNLLAQKNILFKQQSQALNDRMLNYYQHELNRLHNNMKLMDAFSPLKVINRGYAIAMIDDDIVTSIQDLELKDSVNIKVKDGQFTAQVTDIEVGDIGQDFEEGVE